MTWWIVGILLIIVLLLSISLYWVIGKATYMSKKEKDFIKFVIGIYINYAEELNITNVEEHEKLIKELEQIKEKLEK
jgi:hypothetical protein